MSDINITIPGGTSKRLLTKGKRCEDDIVVTAEGGGGTVPVPEDLAAELTEQEALLEELRTTLEGKASGGGSEMLTALIEGTLEELQDDNATVIKTYCFYQNRSIKRAILPNVLKLEDDAFDRAYNLEIAEIPNLEEAGGAAFKETRLTELNFPKLKAVKDSTFWSAKNVKSADLKSVTSIGSNAFQYCGITGGLKKLDFHVLTAIGSSAFYGCSNLEALIIRTNELCTLSNTTALSVTPIAKGTGYVYVPKTLADGSDGVAAYQAATNWSTYAAQIRAIEDYPDITGG